MQAALASRPALVRQILAAADEIIERCAEDARGNHSTECGLLRHEVRKLVAQLGDSDTPRDPALTYTPAKVGGVHLELGWQYRYRCVEVVEAWVNGTDIAALLGDTKLAALADYMTFEVL
jgi:hypothetical protein